MCHVLLFYWVWRCGLMRGLPGETIELHLSFILEDSKGIMFALCFSLCCCYCAFVSFSNLCNISLTYRINGSEYSTTKLNAESSSPVLGWLKTSLKTNYSKTRSSKVKVKGRFSTKCDLFFPHCASFQVHSSLWKKYSFLHLRWNICPAVVYQIFSRIIIGETAPGFVFWLHHRPSSGILVSGFRRQFFMCTNID